MIKNRTYTVLLLLFISLALKAQDIQGPYFVFSVLKNQSISQTYANQYQKKVSVIDTASHGTFTIDSSNRFDPSIHYTPQTGFLGRDTVSYQYQDYYGKIKFFNFVFDVVNSTIKIGADYYLAFKNSDTISVNPLQNDISSIDNSYHYLNIKSIAALNQLFAYKSNDTLLKYKPPVNFTGLSYLSYTICDTFETCVDGSLIINVVDTSNFISDSIQLGTAKNTSVFISLPKAGYSISKNPNKGYLDFNSDYSVNYKPVTGAIGLDTFILVNNNVYRTVFIEIYFVKDPSKLTVDDIVFTPKDSLVTFNVANNDISKQFPFLLDKGPSKGVLTKLNNQGDFSYQPESGYQGIQSFTYKVCPQGLCEYGQVKLFVGNWEPDTRTQYKFSTFRNVPLVISYHIPVDAYSFSSPEDSVKFYPGYDTVYLNYKTCKDTVIGYNLLIYFPPKDFIGTKTFKVNYCIPSTGQCVEADCKVEIKYSDNKDCSILCAGDCVWPGDVNLDGEVTLFDFLEVGYNLGDYGQARTSNNKNPSVFKALRAEDWKNDLPGGYANLKHADIDGNGTVDCLDTVYISNFYRKQHSLVPKPVYDRGDFPFILNVLTPNVKIGDTAYIEVQLGDNANPAINLTGFAYELDYNVDVVHEASLGVNFYKQGWATMNSALMHMFKKPWDGRLESGFARSNANKVSGKGGVEVLSFIVEDDLGGLRKDENYVRIPFYFKNIVLMNEFGYLVQLPEQVAYLNIGNGKKEEPGLDLNALRVYPNPSEGIIYIDLYGENQILSVSLLSLNGGLIKEIKKSEQKYEVLDVQNVPNGLYLLRTETRLGPINKKIEILR